MILDQVFADLEKLAADVEQGAVGVAETVKADVGTLFTDIGSLVQSSPAVPVQSGKQAVNPQQGKQAAEQIRAFVQQHRPKVAAPGQTDAGAQALGDGTILKALLALLQQLLPFILPFITPKAPTVP